MAISPEILEVRALLERAERERDPELKASELEEALISLESFDIEDMSVEERTLVINLRRAHARSLLLQFPSLLTVPFHVWYAYFRVLMKLRPEIDTLIAEDSELRANHERFIKLWRQEVIDALGAGNAL